MPSREWRHVTAGRGRRAGTGGAARRLLAAGIGLLLAGGAAMAADEPYRNPKLPVEQRVDDLLSRMTPEEKVAQLLAVWEKKVELFDADTQLDPARLKAAFPDGLGQFSRPSDRRGPVSPRIARGRDARETVALVNTLQRHAVEGTRLGIPVLFHEEGLHGYAAQDGTHFPQAIALASSWDPELVRRVNGVIAREIRARGVHQALSPVVDVARDPRWGRIEETFGEDPYLVGEMGVAAVRGLQGDTLPLAPGKVFATLKHLTGHGQPESGTNVGPASISERTLREFFFPPFEEVVRRTNIRMVMASYNEIDGVPSHANRWLLHEVLRGEWGFQGAVVSDYFGIDELVEIHRIEPDLQAAAVRAMQAGVDFDLPDGESYEFLLRAVQDGSVSMQQVDEAVRRMLRIKVEAGLFENPYADAGAADALTGNAEARALALEAAHRSVVLLKNDGILPLDPAKLKTLAVVGPNAAVARLGGYSREPRQKISILEGLQAKLAGRVRIVHAQGVRITATEDRFADAVELADPAENRRMIQEAAQVARGADAIVLVIGDTEQTTREAFARNHLGDRTSLDLVGEQEELAAALFALGKPVVVVLINGRPLSVVQVAERANALVEGWYLGQEGGTAMADILLGSVNPGGKLPVTIPRSVGQLPLLYNHKPSALRGYLFETTDPLFPFGHGLSYTTFEVGAPTLSADSIGPAGTVTVSVPVRNTGKRAGDEVVQLYIRDRVSSVTRPVKELRGFQRVGLKPGESRTVRFTLGPRDLSFWDIGMKRVVEPGAFDIMVGPSSADLKSTTLTVTN